MQNEEAALVAAGKEEIELKMLNAGTEKEEE